MTEIIVDKLSKRYGYKWIIKDFDAHFVSNQIYGISGGNGSGKSTLIKMFCGFLSPTMGKMSFRIQDQPIKLEEVFTFISLAAPYTDLINEFSLEEMYSFHRKFKKMKHNLSFQDFENKIMLKGQKDKILQHFSSGMKQKIQLALAVLSDTPILLLDEPTSFLDQDNKAWFAQLLSENVEDRLIIIASNDAFDLKMCHQTYSLFQQ